MGTFSFVRSTAIAFVLALFTAGVLAAPVTTGPSSDHDKDKGRGDVSTRTERSVTKDSPSTSSQAKEASSPRDNTASRTALAPVGGARPSLSAPALAPQSAQPRLSVPSSAFRDGQHDRWNHDRDDHDRDDRDRRDDQPNVYTSPYASGFVSATGSLVGTSAGVLRVEFNGTIWQVRPAFGATTELTGAAGPDFLRPGLVVKFQADFDPNGNDKDKAIAPLTALEIITPRPGETIGAVPADADAHHKAPQPATARSLAVIGQVRSFKQKELVVSAGNHVFKADVDFAPQIKVRMSDFRFARVGDQVQLTGYAERPGSIVASQVLITLAAPLGDPLSEFGKQKPSVKLAAGQK
jgi:hypothetical protein